MHLNYKFRENLLQNIEHTNLGIYFKMHRKIGIKSISSSHFALYTNIARMMETNILLDILKGI
jgi:hypothetical protein